MKIKQNYFATQQGCSEIIRKDGKKYTIRTTRGRFFFPDEWMAFFDNLKDKQKITFSFLINTGARIMEIRNIKVSDIDFDRCNIVLRITKRVLTKIKAGEHGVRNIRIITVSSQFIKYLRSIVKEYNLQPDSLFPILSTPGANIAMKISLEKAGIQDYKMFSIHNVRKTLETWLLALDTDSLQMVKHFGHSLAVAMKHYIGPSIFNFEDKQMMREIIGDIFQK